MKYEQWKLRPGAVRPGGSWSWRACLPLCAVVLCARGLDTPEKAREFLANGPELLHDPFSHADMDRATICTAHGTGGIHRLRRL